MFIRILFLDAPFIHIGAPPVLLDLLDLDLDLDLLAAFLDLLDFLAAFRACLRRDLPP
jgi:hypothetical protein